jgi:hypothetical protein
MYNIYDIYYITSHTAVQVHRDWHPGRYFMLHIQHMNLYYVYMYMGV